LGFTFGSPSLIYQVPDFTGLACSVFSAAQAQQAAQMEQLRQQRILREAVTDAARLAVADQLSREGDVRLAATIYLRIALSRPANASSETAKRRLVDLAEEAKKKLSEIDARLESEKDLSTPREVVGDSPSEKPNQPAARSVRWETPVGAAFRDYEKLARDYEQVPQASREIKRHIAQQRAKPEYASALNEPQARIFWESGQAKEREDQLCCAYWFYDQGARLAPAPSAIRAGQRLDEMKQEAAIMAAAKVCRELQWCHHTYQRAIRLVQARPDQAKPLFAQIVARSPADSEIHRQAATQLAGLP
jgi:hypothetical protein